MSSDYSDSGVVMDGSVPLGGVYANVVNVWHTGLELTLEFAVSLREGSHLPDAVYVAWMKVPPRVAWELAQQISNHVAQFEEEYGRFTPRSPDEEEPS